MLNIYAHSLMTATRNNCLPVHDVLPQNGKRIRWWQPRPSRCIDLSKL